MNKLMAPTNASCCSYLLHYSIITLSMMATKNISLLNSSMSLFTIEIMVNSINVEQFMQW